MPDVDLSHHGRDCTFKTLLRRHDVTDPAVWRLAALVHEEDLDGGRYDAPEAPGFNLALRGLSMVDEERVLQPTGSLLDGAYQLFRRQLLLGREPA